MNPMILETNQLVFNHTINYCNLSIPRCKTTFISGPSGSGKSSLLKLFNGTFNATAGEVIYDGRNILEHDAISLRKSLLLVGQSVYLFDKTIRENFIEFHKYRESPAPTDSDMRFYLDLCCAPFSPDALCTTLSGGERQRVYIAIFLSFKPTVLMLDEPTSALDPVTARGLLKNVGDFCTQQQITLIVISHDHELVETFAQHIIRLEDCAHE